MFKIGDVVQHAVDGRRGRVVGLIQTGGDTCFDVSWEHNRTLGGTSCVPLPIRSNLLRPEDAAAAAAARSACATSSGRGLALGEPPPGTPEWSHWIRTRGY